jgi:hypothetical protein
MRCIFHVRSSAVSDWAERRPSAPAPGDMVEHDGAAYRVTSCGRWPAQRNTTFVALTACVTDDLEDVWQCS